RSLIPSGMPASAASSPLLRALSAVSAAASASSGVSTVYAFSVRAAATAALYASATSRAANWPERMPSRSSAMVLVVRSVIRSSPERRGGPPPKAGVVRTHGSCRGGAVGPLHQLRWSPSPSRGGFSRGPSLDHLGHGEEAVLRVG